LKYAIGEMKEVAALLHGFANYEHPCKKYHHIQIDSSDGLFGRYLTEERNTESTKEHDLPDLELKAAYLPYCYEREDHYKYYCGDICLENHQYSKPDQVPNAIGSI